MNKIKAMRHRDIISFATGIFLLLSPHAHALTFWASNTNDTTQWKSLRSAVIAANIIGGNNTILLGPTLNSKANASQTNPWVYHLTIRGANEDHAITGDLDINRGNLAIVGLTSNVVIDATGLGDRVFQVFSHASLTLENVTITGGATPINTNGVIFAPNEHAPNGGAICNSGNLTMKNCSIVNNSSGNGGYVLSNAFWGASGGGIYNLGNALLMNCRIASNSAGRGAASDIWGVSRDGGYGGGIYNAGSMSLINCTIISNYCGAGGSGRVTPNSNLGGPFGGSGGAGGSGGGIFNYGSMSLLFCTVANNKAGDGGNGGSGIDGGAGGWGGPGGDGGGISSSGTLDLNTCTISGNLCGNGGSGGNGSVGLIAGLNGPGGTGQSGGSGGGLFLTYGRVSVTACTIVLNQAGTGGAGGNGVEPFPLYFTNVDSPGGDGGSGGGIFNVPLYETNAVIRDSLIALNIPNVGAPGGTNSLFNSDPIIGPAGTMGTGYEISGPFVSQGFNLISTGDGGTGFANGENSDQVGTDVNPINPVLGPLQWNGGSTPTHALLPGSPAINQGFSFGLHVDQRGYLRPYLYPGVSNVPNGDGSDIGAFELQTH